MYVHRVYRYPALGKARELAALSREQVGLIQGMGLRNSMSSRLFDENGPVFCSTLLVEDLAALDAAVQRVTDDAGFQAVQERVLPLLARFDHFELAEALVSPVPTGGSAPTLVERTLAYPAVGKGPAMRALLEEYARARQGVRPRVRLSRQLYASSGPAFIVADAFADMAELDRVRHAPDPSMPAFMEQLATLSRASIRSELYRILVPFPA